MAEHLAQPRRVRPDLRQARGELDVGGVVDVDEGGDGIVHRFAH